MATVSATPFSSSILVLSCLFLFFFLSYSEANRELLVGGRTDSWKIPSAPNSDSLNQWSQRSRFIIGDSLVWSYDGTKDSVLRVNKRDYVTCNTSSPIAAYNDGNTKVKLQSSGPHHFISGAEGHCVKGQKLMVVVLSERHSRRFSGIPSPAPSPVEEKSHQGPAMAPTSGCLGLEAQSFFMLAMVFGAGILLLL